MPDTIHRLRVIQGNQPGSPDDLANWRAAGRSLRRIENTLDMYRRQALPPRIMRAVAMGIVSATSLLVLIWGATQFGIDHQAMPWKPARLAIDVLPALIALAVFIYFMRRHDIPRSWAQQLDLDLAQHDPIDRDAYRKLQKVTAELGYLNTDAVLEWTWAERDAISALSGRDAAKTEKSRFLSRDV